MYNYRSNNNDVSSLDVCKNIIDHLKYKLVDRLFINKNFKLNEDHTFGKYRVNIKMVGKGGLGKVYKISSIDDHTSQTKCGHIVIKIIKNNYKNHKDEANSELEMIGYTKTLVDKCICPNLLHYYDVKTVGNYYIILSEYANGTLEDWIKKSRTYDEWRSFMFQLLMGLLCIQEKLKAYHADLRPWNIFYKDLVDRKALFEYNIVLSDKKYSRKFIVPTTGYLHIIADFDKTQSLLLKHNNLNSESIKMYIKNNIDLEHIIDLYKFILVRTIEKKYSLKELISTVNSRNDIYFEGYIKNKEIEIDNELKKFPNQDKNKWLSRSVAEYIVQKEYIGPTDIPQDEMIMKLPPIEIINQFKQWKGMNILDIIDSFTEFAVNENSLSTENNTHITKFCI